ncbi:pyrroloquinoline quinone biosynthesis protein PqqF [Pseudomonas sp. GOM7]|uniref:pyrroloquinoline quinone biosynthesis protein PqqF n=1 Tax=Pseudomonas sp. GOM7 TaxID=2998079 RepID=UPI00227AD554|nr:pyrroloquinoline quinone biosynthesis protein PqqF [Pseudomonas sp. GOM7]WAJ39669.1 pyrroloquinoline quinone biosynthesis protein PqqF [Pseudomonas sp. GOM7]
MPASALPVHTRHLANGAVLHACQQPWARQAGLCLRVAVGSHDEPRDYPGLAHFLEHLLFLGSRGHAVEQGLMAYVRGCGGQVNASTQARHTDFVCQLPAAGLQPALQRLQDMLSHPLLEQAAQRREREVLHAEYQARSQDADSRIDHALGQAVAAGHRCADFLAGDRHSLALEQAAFQQALQGYHRQHYQARYMSLALVGPQPLEELLSLGEACLLSMAGGALGVRASPSLLPLRASRLVLQHPIRGVTLGLAVQLPEKALEPALQLFLEALHDPAPGGLQAGLRQAGLCQALQVRVIYRHEGQRLLRLDCPGADSTTVARLQAELRGWLQRLPGDPGWGARWRAWQQAQAARLAGLSPLALAQHLLQQPEAIAEVEVLAALQPLLVQLASGAGLIELCSTSEAQPLWPALGLDLQMQAVAARSLAAPTLDLHLPQACTALAPATSAPPMPMAALRWHAGPEQGGPAALHWRGPCSDNGLPTPVRLATLQARIADQAKLCQRHGVALQLRAEPGAWTLALSGPAPLLPASSVRLLPLLLAPLDEAVAPPAAGLLLRQVLEYLPELGQSAAPTILQGLGVGLGTAAQQEIEALFEAVEPLPATTPQPHSSGGLSWHEAPVSGAESALLLFCPVPDASVQAEAAWRLLDQCLQEAFYQRLRGELQLGYALFSSFRQVQGRRGLLFGVQSPVCDHATILGHIRAFLAAQPARLAGLPAQAFEQAREALQLALQAPRSHVEWAEQFCQAHLAALAAEHDQAVGQALSALDSLALLHACRQLLAECGWQVLSSTPNH